MRVFGGNKYRVLFPVVEVVAGDLVCFGRAGC